MTNTDFNSFLTLFLCFWFWKSAKKLKQSRDVDSVWSESEVRFYPQQVCPSACQTDPLRLRGGTSGKLWGGFVDQQQSCQADPDHPGPGRDPDLQTGGFQEQSAQRGGPSDPGEFSGGVWLQGGTRGNSSRGHGVLRLHTPVYRLSRSELWPLLQVHILRFCWLQEQPMAIKCVFDRARCAAKTVQTEISQQLLDE